MLFNSFGFAIFLPVVFILYWFATNGNIKRQNALLLLASYFFYGCWEWRFLCLLLFSTFLDYTLGKKIQDSPSLLKKRFWLWVSVGVNLGILGLFKYFHFFVQSFALLISSFGFNTHFNSLQFIVPVGISFYTFHGLSYVLDIYRNKITPERSILNYAVFVSFFPLLVAGPIERATHLLPQIIKKREFDYLKAVDGLRQILWGLFKKILIADNCAEYVNVIFNDSANMNGSTLLLGALFFAFQIYGDFSGYSDIAIGTARLFGIELLRNFAFPYFSRDMAEFWRRWHISLSSWFKDYVYIPLGGSKGGIWMRIRNVFIVFTLSALWHGAKWTFVVWGLLNALFILPLIVLNTNRNNLEIVAKGENFPTVKAFFQISFTFCLTTFAWIFVRANDLEQAFSIISQICSKSLLTIPYFPGIGAARLTVVLVFFLLIVEWIGREDQYAIKNIGLQWNRFSRWIFYYLLILLIFNFSGPKQQFIYFQF